MKSTIGSRWPSSALLCQRRMSHFSNSAKRLKIRFDFLFDFCNWLVTHRTPLLTLSLEATHGEAPCNLWDCHWTQESTSWLKPWNHAEGRNCTSSRWFEAEDTGPNWWCDEGCALHFSFVWPAGSVAASWNPLMQIGTVDCRLHLPSWALSTRWGCSRILRHTIKNNYEICLKLQVNQLNDSKQWLFLGICCQLVPFCNLPQPLMFECGS